MKKSQFDNRNYGYILSKDDYFEFPIIITDTLQEIADYLGISLSAVSRLYTRKPTRHIKALKIERVQLYDYVYMIFNNDITSPSYVARDILTLANKSRQILSTIREYLYYSNKKHYKHFKVCCIDLFEQPESYRQYIQECLKVDKVTKSFEEYEKEKE